MKPAPPPPRRSRIFDSVSSGAMEVLGKRPAALVDIYYYLVAGSWWRLLATFGLAYLLFNGLFALGFVWVGGVENARPGSFRDAFFFSVQTFATIGYGAMYAKGTNANLLVTVEALMALLTQALATGLVFAKFSRPRARVLFSRVAVISERNGQLTLMFRVANERTNHVVEAQMRVALLREERTREGERLRRIIDLPLVRERSPMFILT
ncbi:MAG: ion channel, partial [Myxococcaceae bacterium]|nr:ion channel [Myxococcaceae bacterium]